MLLVGGVVGVTIRLLTGEVLLAVAVGLVVAFAIPYVIVLPVMPGV